MKITSNLFNAIAGRLGTYVGLMNEGGMCMRTYVVPPYRNTNPQLVVRQALIDATAAWKGTLTASARSAWSTYARSIFNRSTIGTRLRQSGAAAHAASAVARALAGLARVDVAPSVGGWATHQTIVPTWDAGAGTVSLAFDPTDTWASAVGGALIVRSAPLGCGPGVNYYRGPFRYKGCKLGDSPPAKSPLTLSITYEFDGQAAIAFRTVDPDGRISRLTYAHGGT
jgi:hypothetical protein